MRESIAILAYLDAAFPAIPLFGETPDENARIWQAVIEIETVLRPPAVQIARGLFRGTADPTSPDIRAAADEMSDEMDRIERSLADGQPWICGTEFTAADVALYPTLAWLFRALDRAEPEAFAVLRTERRHLTNWQGRMEAMDWFDATYPPHRR